MNYIARNHRLEKDGYYSVPAEQTLKSYRVKPKKLEVHRIGKYVQLTIKFYTRWFYGVNKDLQHTSCGITGAYCYDYVLLQSFSFSNQVLYKTVMTSICLLSLKKLSR